MKSEKIINISRMKELDREALAWCAGFFDGEGYVGCENNSNGWEMIRIVIPQCDPRVLEFFDEYCMKRGKINFVKSKNLKHSDQWRLVYNSFQNVQFIMCLLWPWLKPVKRLQFVNSMGLYLSRYHESGKFHRKKFGKNTLIDGKIVCNQCWIAKPPIEFSPNKNTISKHNSTCKKCINIRAKKRKERIRG